MEHSKNYWGKNVCFFQRKIHFQSKFDALNAHFVYVCNYFSNIVVHFVYIAILCHYIFSKLFLFMLIEFPFIIGVSFHCFCFVLPIKSICFNFIELHCFSDQTNWAEHYVSTMKKEIQLISIKMHNR